MTEKILEDELQTHLLKVADVVSYLYQHGRQNVIMNAMFLFWLFRVNN
ncbi:MAG: hypothetical protein KME64_10845 [Scytonematopsis contorta HA4267-MV1]|nr:hypothetical protein [Scytonematopsis contorta HA4267-MV1]